MLVIYCHRQSQRLSYAVSIVFDVVCKSTYKLTEDRDEFLRHDGPKIHYSKDTFEGIPGILPSGLLTDQFTLDKKPEKGIYKDVPHIFPNRNAFLPFDVFSAIFYMVSRYEEYGDFEPDRHGRFPMQQSTAYELGFHKKAIVHHWSKQLIDALFGQFPALVAEKNHYKFEIGMDIDNAYAYRHKNVFRTIGGLSLSILNPVEYINRLAVLTGNRQDPYDNYDYIFNVLSRNKTTLKTFFLCAAYGTYDKNITPGSKVYRHLVERAKNHGEIGLHPSYASNKRATLETELKTLSELSGKPLQMSRQHFLMLNFPKTYETLLKAGIKHDYSMGYAESAGFRAGIAVPFPFYNVKEDKTTDLIIHPFVFMESCYIHYQAIDIDEIKAEISAMIDEVKSVNGIFHAVWHNEYFGGKGGEKWKELFEYMLEQGSTT